MVYIHYRSMYLFQKIGKFRKYIFYSYIGQEDHSCYNNLFEIDLLRYIFYSFFHKKFAAAIITSLRLIRNINININFMLFV